LAGRSMHGQRPNATQRNADPTTHHAPADQSRHMNTERILPRHELTCWAETPAR
jgi:hypothetical protein